MLSFLPIIAELIPGFIRLLGADHTGEAADRLTDAVKDATRTDDPGKAQAALAADPSLKLQLQQTLAAIALDELKEQDRAAEEQRRIDLEFYRDALAEKDRDRQQEFDRYVRDLQDRQSARSDYMRLAEAKNPLAWVGPILAFVLMILIFYCLRSILVAREPIENKDVFNTVLGALVTAFTTVISFYFGSSASSKEKDRLVADGVLVAGPRKPDGGPAGAAAPGAPPAVPPTVGAPPLAAAPGRAGVAPPPAKAVPPSPLAGGPLGLFASKAPDIMRRLIADLGLSGAQAAGILGNMGHECGGFRKLQEQRPLSGRGGWGWCQWTGPRRRDFESWAAANNLGLASDAANYGFLLHELKGTQAPTLRSLRQTQTVAAATADFMNHFEKPAAQFAGLDSRLKFAQLALREYGRVYGG